MPANRSRPHTIFLSNACKHASRPPQGADTKQGHLPDKEDRITYSLQTNIRAHSTKKALCPPNTHCRDLPCAGSSIHVNQSQFSATSVPWSNSSRGRMNPGATECGKAQDWDFSFTANPDLYRDSKEKTPRDLDRKSFFFVSAKIQLHKNDLYECALLTQPWEH